MGSCRSLTRCNGWMERCGSSLPRPGTRGRTIPLPPPCLEALRAHRVAQGKERLASGGVWADLGMVFTTAIGTPIEPDNLRRSWYAVRKVLGDPPPRFHDLRHTCVSLLLGRRRSSARGPADRGTQRDRRHDDDLRACLARREADSLGQTRGAPRMIRLRSEMAVRTLGQQETAGRACALTCGFCGGQGRGRTADLPLFRRTLVPTELPGRTSSRASAGAVTQVSLRSCEAKRNLTGPHPGLRTGRTRPSGAWRAGSQPAQRP